MDPGKITFFGSAVQDGHIAGKIVTSSTYRIKAYGAPVRRVIEIGFVDAYLILGSVIRALTGCGQFQGQLTRILIPNGDGEIAEEILYGWNKKKE